MKTIGTYRLISFFDASPEAREATCTDVRNGDGHPVSSFMELARKTAELQFRNPELELLFRGQRRDYRNLKGNSSLKPTLLRGERTTPARPPAAGVLERRYETLRFAEQQLITLFDAQELPARSQLRRQRILRWAILQHYEICDTPLLDVSRSLRIAASFATVNADDEAFLFVLGVPSLSGVLSVSIECGLQTVKLAGICPPMALRPHIQEGYLLAEFPELGAFDQKVEYEHYETDFGRRLLAKFRFNPTTFWNDVNFPVIPRSALYPDAHDSLHKLLAAIQSSST